MGGKGARAQAVMQATAGTESDMQDARSARTTWGDVRGKSGEAHLYSGHEDGVRLAVLVARVRADEGAEIVVLDLLLVPAHRGGVKFRSRDFRTKWAGV